MGFGFNLFMILFVVPLSAILLITWFITGKHHWGKIIGFLWLGLLAMVMVLSGLNWILGKPNLEKDDYYGQYIVDRTYFSGKQADWQYNHFRFEIKDNDSLYFYVTEKEKIIRTYVGKIEVTNYYISEHLLINMPQPTHHILSSNPTTYRYPWYFHLVFYSPKFNNLYFKKGKWEAIDSNWYDSITNFKYNLPFT